jgi:flagellar motor switch protein FliN/FliY
MGVQSIELEELMNNDGNGKPLLKENMELIKNVKVKLDVVVGNAELTVGDLFALGGGSVVKLDRNLSDPVDVILDGKVVARGMLVAVDDNFGIKIVEFGDEE